jgi:uncharacterized protein (TIGR02118 family)
MIKRISFLQRLPGTTHEAFVDHWTGPHTEIVRTLPGLRGMRLGVVDGVWTPPGSPAWDGIGELWFDSAEAAAAAFASEPHAARLAVDRPQFIGAMQAGFVREITVIDPPAEGG